MGAEFWTIGVPNIGWREKSWALCERVGGWCLRIILLLLFVGMISFSILPVRPKTSLSDKPNNKHRSATDSASSPEVDGQPSQPQLQPQRRTSAEKNGWDSTRSVLGKTDSGNVTSSFRNAGINVKMVDRDGRGRTRSRSGEQELHGELDVEDTCILQ
jgi:hypothetical protein